MEPKIKLWSNKKKRGTTISSNYYRLLTNFIISEVEAKRSGKIFLQELIEKAKTNFSKQITGDISWWLLQVKRDLEVKGVIRISFTPSLNQFIELKKRFDKNAIKQAIKESII